MLRLFIHSSENSNEIPKYFYLECGPYCSKLMGSAVFLHNSSMSLTW